MNLGPETERVEYKKSTGELKEGVQSIASILNKHDSGELYFGVRDDGEVVGQQIGARTLRDVSQAIANSIEPRVYATVEALCSEDEKSYVKVAFSGEERPYACKGAYRIRVADEDLPMTTAQLESQMTGRLIRRDPWDARASLRPLEDIDEATLEGYVVRGRSCGRIGFEYDGAKSVLERLGLLTLDGGLTNAAAVLFCKSKVARLKMGVFTNAKRIDILDIQQVNGTLFDLLRQAHFYVLSNIRRRVVISGDKTERDEIPELPMDAVREALVNALVHQDYIADEAIRVEIYPGSVEIYNAGWFIDGQLPERHLAGESRNSKTRNELIANALFKSKDIEHFGTGMPRLQELCDEAGVKVEYLRRDGGTCVVFYRNDPYEATGDSLKDSELAGVGRSWPELAGVGRSDRDRHILDLAQTGATASEVAASLGVSARTARRLIAMLVDEGLLIPEGETNRRVYYSVGHR